MRYRADLDGLRAIAVVLVVAYHAGVPGFAGGYVGVDVFFALSGFLITGLLLAEIGTYGRIDLAAFWGRRVRRLLPLATFVLVSTTSVAVWLSAPLARRALLDDAQSALVYMSNLRFARQAVAYSDVSVTDSPVLHYWSLSIEEQFYVLWPLSLAAALTLARGRAASRSVIGLVGAVVVGASAWWSVLSSVAGGSSYFSTTARLWEIAAGGLLAIVVQPHRLVEARRGGAGLRTIVAVTGLAMAVVGAGVYDSATPYPSWRAMLPVVGTLVSIAVGSGTVVERILSHRALVWLGRRSYALYLWHWPLLGLVPLAAEQWGIDSSSLETSIVAIAIALVLAAVSREIIEEPIRRAARLVSSPYLSLAVGGIAMAMAALVLVGLGRFDSGNRSIDLTTLVAPADAKTPTTPGPRGQDLIAVPPPVPMRPADARMPVEACHGDQVDQDLPPPDECRLGPDRPLGDGPRVVLLGDSHARTWIAPLRLIAEQTNIDAYAWTKSSCFMQDAVIYRLRTGVRYLSCERWRQLVTDQLIDMSAEHPIDLVVIARKGLETNLGYPTGGRVGSDPDAIRAVWRAAVDATVEALEPTGAAILFLGDVPRPGYSIPECLSEHPDDPAACSFPVAPSISDRLLSEVERERADDVTVYWADTVPLACPADPCPAVTPDGTITYYDSHHLTPEYATRLAPDLFDLLVRTGALEGVERDVVPVTGDAHAGSPRGGAEGS